MQKCGKITSKWWLAIGTLGQQQHTTWLARQHAKTSTQVQAWCLNVVQLVGSMIQLLKGTWMDALDEGTLLQQGEA